MAFIETHDTQMAALMSGMPQVSAGTAVAFRREPAPRTWRTPAERNVRPVEAISPQRAPDPIRAGDTPARPARMPIVTFLAIRAIKSVMSDEFRIKALAPNHVAAYPRGVQNALVERGNIRRPAAETYGSLFTIDPPDPYAVL